MKKSFILATLVVTLLSPLSAYAVDSALLKKAQAGDAYAQTNLGYIYREGKGVPQDY